MSKSAVHFSTQSIRDSFDLQNKWFALQSTLKVKHEFDREISGTMHSQRYSIENIERFIDF
jgi:hypothetical protein